jgi:uncharacterized protein
MSENRPWYREPFVWLIIALPLTAVIAGLTTLYIAVVTRDGMVADDYYQRGLEINRFLDRDRAAARLGLKAQLHLDAATESVVVRFVETVPGAMLPKTITLHWMYATRSGHDRTEQLVLARDGAYRAEIPELVPGHWYVRIEAQDWRLQGSMRMPEDTGLALSAATRNSGPLTQ